jgi:hypothetical protein
MNVAQAPGPRPEEIIKDYVAPPPHPKHITIDLAYHRASNSFQVVRITDSTWRLPGDWLLKDYVDQLVLNPGWTVAATNFDYLQAIGSMFGLAASTGLHAAL